VKNKRDRLFFTQLFVPQASQSACGMEDNMDVLEQIRGGLIVSCQALEDEPLHSSFIMGRMALAAYQGGAKGIRANSVSDIQEIKKMVPLPIIGIIKKNYPDAEVYITPGMEEADALCKAGVDIIALDATNQSRPGGVSLEKLYGEIRRKYPRQLLMADCSTYEEAVCADRLGFDFIGTTLVGYTPQSKGIHIEENDFELIRNILADIRHPMIAEGNIDTPQKARRVIELGAYSVVVGSIITRPQVITKRFVSYMEQTD
jgi:N-acylglucosamine-6-phosphate 2-epimerase